jgi:Flp pilus assembly protein TadG
MSQRVVPRVRKAAADPRRGAVAVEFAFVMPFFFVLLFGIIEAGRAIEVAHILITAAREGARLGSMEKEDVLGDDQSAAEKIEQDIRNFLTASGIPGDAATIEITTVPDTAGGSAVPFSFEDPENDLAMYQITVSIPFSAVTYCPPPLQKYLTNQDLTRVVVFRNGRAAVAG